MTEKPSRILEEEENATGPINEEEDKENTIVKQIGSEDEESTESHSSTYTAHTNHRQVSSSSSIDSVVDSPLKRHSSTKHRTRASTTACASSGPKHRKRLSMNFTTLPVMSPNGQSQQQATTSPTASSNQPTSFNTPSSSPLLNHRRTFSSYVDSPPPPRFSSTAATTTTPLPSSPSRHHKQQSRSVDSDGSSIDYSSQENFFAELAAKERKVVELKDEFKRVKEALRMAELELNQFRNRDRTAITQPEREREPDAVDHSRPSSGVFNTNAVINQPESAYQPLASPEPAVSTYKVPSQGGLQRSKSLKVPPQSHFIQQVTPPGRDDVLNMGKRVVEELGTQFWGLFDDIRNATIGEEPRSTAPIQRPRNAHLNDQREYRKPHRDQQQQQQQQQHQPKPQQQKQEQQKPESEHQRRDSENSYYII